MRSPRSAGTSTEAVLKARERAPFSLPLALASSSAFRPTPIQAPRPGALVRTSGATCPSGPSASRISSSRGAVRLVRMQLRSDTCASSGSFWGFRIGGLPGFRLILEPMGSGSHDDLVTLLFAQAVFSQNARLFLGALVGRF